MQPTKLCKKKNSFLANLLAKTFTVYLFYTILIYDLQPSFITACVLLSPLYLYHHRATHHQLQCQCRQVCLQMLLRNQRVIKLISTHPVVCREDAFCQSVRSPPALVKATNLTLVLYPSPTSTWKYNLRVQWDISPSTS